jgi:hypothetical protein
LGSTDKLRVPNRMIYESVISTRNVDGSAHLSPMGYRFEGDQIVLAPFVPSTTLDNLRRDRGAVLNFTDDVSVIAGCLTGRRDWPTIATHVVAGWRLATTLAHRELSLLRCDDDERRPSFYFATEFEQQHASFKGFNRAQASIVEAAILLTRLDWLARKKVTDEIAYLSIAISKTAGPLELVAWDWILEAIQRHPAHDISSVLST